MKSIFKKLVAFILLLLSSFSGFSQAYQFKNYSVDNGITQPYVYSIVQDKNGYLWIGTGEGFCKFDGVTFKTFYTKEGLSDNFITSTYKDKNRNLWIGHNQGSVTFFDGKTFKSINTSGFAKSPVTQIVGDDKGFIWCATQNDGIFRINKSFEVEVFKIEFDQYNVFSIALSKNNDLLVGTAEGLIIYELIGDNRKPKFIAALSEIENTKVNCIVKKNNSTSFWVGTQDLGLMLISPSAKKAHSYTTKIISPPEGCEIMNIQAIFEDKVSNLWIATFGSGVIKLTLSKNTLSYNEFAVFNEANGLGNNYTKTIYSDHEDNIWVGTFGSGAVMLTDNLFTFYSHSNPNYTNNITSIFINEVKWFGTESGLLKIDLNAKEKWLFYNSKNGFVDDRITSIYKKDNNTLYLGTEKNGAYKFDIPTGRFSSIFLNEDALSNSISFITGYENKTFYATKAGVFKIDDGKKITTHYTTENGLPHNNINQLYLDKNNRLWIATHSNFISYIETNDAVKNKKIYFGNDLINITGILEDYEGRFWLPTFGSGVFIVNKKGDIERLTTENGLKSNYCYSVTNDASNNIWIGHRGGLSKVKAGNRLISRYDKNDGIDGDCNYNALTKDQYGNAWFGTTHGAIKFDPHKDKKNLIPPIVNISSIKLNDKDVDSLKNIVLDYDNYKIRFDFIGISFKANTNISYQYKLEGFDEDWSDKSDNNFAQYGKISDGNYTFLVKAYNNDGVSSEIPIAVNITINPPFWKRTWFILLCIIIFAYGIFIIIKIRERNHRVFQAQLQKTINEKTREVIEQKDEIVKKNKDITDSIRYAKRIQDAILPGINKLKDVFPESFIFFQPRDIVSGDFYWFELYGNKLIIACADATGHGVPGAFMSMIGNTLLKDITSRSEVTSPAHALAALELETKILLHQFDDDPDQTNDSIDLVVCEIDIETYFVRICSTKRPVFVSMNNELKLLKKEVSENNEYETTDIQLGQGDLLYFFTDGYPDQFGGETGKKLKIAAIRELLEDIKSLPVEKQSMIIDRFFNRWKEGNDQIDDVLFMGIKL